MSSYWDTGWDLDSGQPLPEEIRYKVWCFEQWKKGYSLTWEGRYITFSCPVCGYGRLKYVYKDKAKCQYYKCNSIIKAQYPKDLIVPPCLRAHSDMPFLGNGGIIMHVGENTPSWIKAREWRVPDCRDPYCLIHPH